MRCQPIHHHWPALLVAALLLFATSGIARAQCKVVDADLTKGAPKDKRFTVNSGEWKNGWKVTGDLDRIVIDAGYDIKNGYFEVVVARQGGIAFSERKRNWMAALACAEGHQCPGGMARAGAESYAFSKAEIFSATQTNTICEKKFGEYADWVMDDKTLHTVRAEVRNGVMRWTNKVGAKTGQSACGDESQPVTHFRYATVGGVLTRKEGWHHGSLVGLRALRMTVVDYDRANGCKGQPAPEPGVVFDMNLRQGAQAFKGTARGGEWNEGWRVTGNDQLIGTTLR